MRLRVLIFQAEDGIRYIGVTGVQTCALPITALRERGTSLLPVGIVDVLGEFHAGDAVEVTARNGDGGPIGKGIVNYSAGELRRIKGLKTAEVRHLLPRASDEAVHRDYFVLE